MKHLTILLLLFSIIFSSELILAQQNAGNTQQEIIELKKEFDKLQLKNEKLENEIQQLKIDNANTSGKVESFDSNLNSYNNHFGSILQYFFWTVAIIVALLSIVSWQSILKRISKLEVNQESLQNKIANVKDELSKEIIFTSESVAKISESTLKNLDVIRMEAFRASYFANYFSSNFSSTIVFASMCLDHHIKSNKSDNQKYWLKRVQDCAKKIKHNGHKISIRVSEGVQKRLFQIKKVEGDLISEENENTAHETIELIKQITKQQ